MLEITPTISAVLSGVASLLAVLLAAAVLLKDRRSPVHRSFAAGMVLLAVKEVMRASSYSAIQPDDVVARHTWLVLASSLVPGTWLFFSVVFARSDFSGLIRKWKWVLAAAFLIPVLLPTAFRAHFFAESAIYLGLSTWLLPLGWAGQAFHFVTIICAILILANLERTLRTATGRIRWQIKFTVVGLGTLCAAWIYSGSQALLYRSMDTGVGLIQPAAVIAASGLFFWAMARSQFLDVDVYLSHTTIHFSLTVLLAAGYLLAVGLMARWLDYAYPERSFPLDALLVLLALIGLGILLLSDRLQERLKRFVTRHFRRPRHDYRKAWMELIEGTTSLASADQLCTAVAKLMSRTLNILSVNIWLLDETKQRLTLAGSTVFTREQAKDLERGGGVVLELVRAVRKSDSPVDFMTTKLAWADEIVRAKPEFYAEYGLRCALPIQAGDRLVGIITLNDDRVGGAALTLEDQDLLRAYAAHLGAGVLQRRLSESRRQAQEFETFQQVSTFFVHDLKNLASRLSLTVQNLPHYIDNPEFRADALRIISQSLDAIEERCSRISSLRKHVEIKTEEVDLKALVAKTLDDLERSLKVPLERDLKAVPPALIDAEQVQKVLVNLVLNAEQASDGRGRILVKTFPTDGSVALSVEDSGCGMSRQFIEKSLFRPFQTTKKQGMGIGLFHSRMIVEAHRGRIEVDSEEGKGSVFRVILPQGGSEIEDGEKNRAG